MSSLPKAKDEQLLRKAGSTRRFALTKPVLVVGLCAALFVGWWLWTQRGASETSTYETQPIGLGVVERTISSTGPVKALVTVDVGTQLSGLIAEMKADFNDRVKEGDLLAIIDRGPFEAAHASALADLAIARAEVGLRQASVAKAQHQLAQYERDVERYRILARSGSTSPRQLEQAETEIATAKDDYAVARAQVESAEGTVARREAALRQAQIDLDRTMIRSPINGVVIDRKMQPGQTVAAVYQTPILFQIAQDLSQIQVWAHVDEADIGAVRPATPVTFSVEAFPDQTFAGMVDQVRLAATKTSGVVTYTVIIRAENPDQKLYPEMTATVRIVAARRENVLAVPSEALRFRPQELPAGTQASAAGRATLWVMGADGKLAPRWVRIGLKGDRSAEILDGDIKAGEEVVLRAENRNQEGQP